MGCGASSAGDGNDAAPKRWRENRTKRHEARPPSDATTLDTSALSTALLDDLRQRQRVETASMNPVKNWIESIASPSDQDNPDLYDPLRRHRLSMESVVQKQRRSVTAHTSHDASDGLTSRPSATDAQGVSDGGAEHDEGRDASNTADAADQHQTTSTDDVQHAVQS